jgi:hypothetical protein
MVGCHGAVSSVRHVCLSPCNRSGSGLDVRDATAVLSQWGVSVVVSASKATTAFSEMLSSCIGVECFYVLCECMVTVIRSWMSGKVSVVIA